MPACVACSAPVADWLDVTSAESTVETSYSFSGGAAGTLVGRVAVVLAVTIVFGLIAIYTLEWLSQVSRGASD